MPPDQTTTLELEDEVHERNRRWEWFAERCGMVLVATTIIAAVLGLLGPGPLGRRIIASADRQFWVDHHAIQRYQAPAKLVIGCQAPSSGSGVIRLRLSRSFSDHVTLEQITPEPETTELTDNHLVYSFRASDLTGDGKILFRFKHDDYGSSSYTVAVESSKIELAEFVLP